MVCGVRRCMSVADQLAAAAALGLVDHTVGRQALMVGPHAIRRAVAQAEVCGNPPDALDRHVHATVLAAWAEAAAQRGAASGYSIQVSRKAGSARQCDAPTGFCGSLWRACGRWCPQRRCSAQAVPAPPLHTPFQVRRSCSDCQWPRCRRRRGRRRFHADEAEPDAALARLVDGVASVCICCQRAPRLGRLACLAHDRVARHCTKHTTCLRLSALARTV